LRLRRPCSGKMAAHGRSNPDTRKKVETVPIGAMKPPLGREQIQGMSHTLLRRRSLR